MLVAEVFALQRQLLLLLLQAAGLPPQQCLLLLQPLRLPLDLPVLVCRQLRPTRGRWAPVGIQGLRRRWAETN